MRRHRASLLSAGALQGSSERAFTLVELMTVVVIVGILATLATYGVRKYVMEAKKAEASSMLVQIRAAEEAFKDETFVYAGLTDFENWHPTNTPGTGKRGWQSGTTAMTVVMNRLGVMPDGPVAYSYAVAAGNGGTMPSIPTVKSWDFPDATGPYYIAMAKADLNGDGVYTYALSHSDTAEIYVDETF
jgi:prepilin-type N-terminal cleavage/methylation domain-containing protein